MAFFLPILFSYFLLLLLMFGKQIISALDDIIDLLRCKIGRYIYRIGLIRKVGMQLCSLQIVFITLDSGEVSEYASNGSGHYVVSGGDGLLVSRKMPRICGVAVVCFGGERIEVRRELTELISAALNIGTNRIHVSGR